MQEKTKVKIIGGAIARKGKKGIVTTAQGTGNNLGKVEIYIDRIGHFWYDPKDLKVIEEPPPPEPPKPKLIHLKIKQIRIDGGTQIREKINQRTVEEYAEDMKQGASFPPIVVFLDSENNHWLSDGFHRVLAAAMADRNEILAEVHQGSLRDAILYSCGANATHGLRRSRIDKRNSVLRLLKDPEWVKWSDREVAKRCGCHHQLVGRLRSSLDDSPVRKEVDENKKRTYKTKHGTIAQMDTSNIGKSSGAELKEGCRVKVKDDFGVRPGEIGTIDYFPNNNSAMVIFADNRKEVIPKVQLEISTAQPELENTGNSPAGEKKKAYSSVKEELDDKQEELGLGKPTGDSVMPETDRLDDLQHSNPTDIDDRPFANEPITKINPKSLVNNFAIHATELGKDDYRSIGKIITKAKPEAIEDVAEMMADTEAKALAIIEAINNKYPNLLREEMF